MSSMLPSDQNKKNRQEPFGELVRSMHDFLHEKPIRGFLQSIDDFFTMPFPFEPAFHVETIEKDNEYVITAEMPGIKREQIEINVQGNYLTISLHNKEIEIEQDEVKKIYHQKQFQQRSSRTVFLPHAINERKIKASYRDGLLQIRIPQEKGKIIDIE